MWFIDYIVEQLVDARDWLLDAYSEVSGWIFPFSYLSYPLWGLYQVFYYLVFYFGYFNDWLDWASGRLNEILSTWDIQSYFQWWLDAAANAWDWVYNAWDNIWQEVDTWWSTTKLTVQGWLDWLEIELKGLISQVDLGLTSLRHSWDNFVSKIPTIDEIIEWFKNWGGNVWSEITNWWSSTVNDVQGLIDSAFVSRESFWSGWQDVRDNVIEFFSNPLDWLASHIEDWFWGEESK